MTKPFVSIHKATSISTAILLLALAPIAYYNVWWPYIMLAIGLSLAVRQILVRKIYDAIISLIIFGGIFITVFYQLSWLPVLFVVAGLYVLFRAAQGGPEDEVEEEEETQVEIEEEEEDKK